MRLRTLAIAAVLSTALGHTGDAFAPRKGGEPSIVASGRAPRVHRDVTWTSPAGLPGWRAQWDRDTDVPLRLWGPSIAAPSSIADPAAAETAARAFLAAQLPLLAPGAAATDFTPLANDLTNGIRTVTFQQSSNGLRVVGGAVGFTFVRDHLIMVSSTALPNVRVRMPGGALAAPMLDTSAIGWLGQAGHAVAITGHGAREIIPVIYPRGNGAVDIS